MKKSKELSAVIDVAKKAGRILLKYSNTKLTKTYKGSKFDFMTQVDMKSEKFIINALKKKFPKYGFLAEETASKKPKEKMYWVIDPLDGTVNYANGIPHYSVSIALAQNNGEIKDILLGVIFDPVKNELYHAEKNKGAFLNGKKIKVSDEKDLSRAVVVTGFYYDRGKMMKHNLKIIEKMFLAGIGGLRRTGVCTLDMSYTACGRFGGYWEYYTKPWDHAAASLILYEAGGKITTIRNEKFNIYTDGFLATNSLLHKKMMKIIKSAGKF